MKKPSEIINGIGPPSFWKEAHAVLAAFYFFNIPVAILTSLKESLPYLIFISLMTAVSGEMAAMPAEAARAVLEDDCETSTSDEGRETGSV